MLIHLITLQRTGHRLREFLVRNGSLGLPLVYFPAIDGHALNVPALIEEGIIKREILETYTAGHLGNPLSHLAIWRKATETNEVITVCEDDAVFNHNFVSRAGPRQLGEAGDRGRAGTVALHLQRVAALIKPSLFQRCLDLRDIPA